MNTDASQLCVSPFLSRVLYAWTTVLLSLLLLGLDGAVHASQLCVSPFLGRVVFAWITVLLSLLLLRLDDAVQRACTVVAV